MGKKMKFSALMAQLKWIESALAGGDPDVIILVPNRVDHVLDGSVLFATGAEVQLTKGWLDGSPDAFVVTLGSILDGDVD